MRGRWAAGIVPRNFSWIIKDRLAVSERPGGYGQNHRKVRRKEELLWLKAQHFDRVVSLLGSSHNLHAYDELGLTWAHFPIPPAADLTPELSELYPSLHAWLRGGERLLVHQDELGDRLMGIVSGYLLWSGLIPDGARVITATEQLLKRQMGAGGRQIVSIAAELPPPSKLQPPAAPLGGPIPQAP
ncbi:MAG: protein-tyrosine phosphatase family protein [Acidimicrobiales bacterium]